MSARRMLRASQDAACQADRQAFHAQYPGYYLPCRVCGRLYLTRSGRAYHEQQAHPSPAAVSPGAT